MVRGKHWACAQSVASSVSESSTCFVVCDQTGPGRSVPPPSQLCQTRKWDLSQMKCCPGWALLGQGWGCATHCLSARRVSSAQRCWSEAFSLKNEQS